MSGAGQRSANPSSANAPRAKHRAERFMDATVGRGAGGVKREGQGGFRFPSPAKSAYAAFVGRYGIARPRQRATEAKLPGQAAVVMVTRLEPAEIPSGRRTRQRRTLRSTRNTRLPSPGAWSVATSKKRKSGPNWTTGKDLPRSSRRIFTSAECPP